MSTFTVPIVAIGDIRKHPNADTLSITEVEGCPVIFRTGDFQMGQYAIYVPVDAVVPLDKPAFAFLADKEGKTKHRIKAKKLRGVFSMGLLAPMSALPADFKIPVPSSEANVAEALGIVKYEEPVPNMKLGGGKREGRQPDGSTAPLYDIESFRKYKKVFLENEEVVVTEKIHGCNARYVFRQAEGEDAPRLFVGSRNFFNKESDVDVWWKIARKLDLATKLAQYPDLVLYGEVYGQVQDLKYGTTPEDPLRFAAFDIYDKKLGRFWDYDSFADLCKKLEIPTVPVLYRGPFDAEKFVPMAEGTSMVAPTQIREGFVVKPVIERWDDRLGRVITKLHGEAYLLRKGGTEYQ